MPSITSCTSFLSSRTQPAFSRFFTCFGVKLYRYYGWFLFLGILLTIITTGSGVLYAWFECQDGTCTENRIDYLWIPRTAKVWFHFTEIIDLFGSYPSPMVLLLNTVDPDDSILTPTNMDIGYEIYDVTNNFSMNYADTGNTYYYSDLCFRSHPLSPYCDSQLGSFFGFFFQDQQQYGTVNEDLWTNDTMVQEKINSPDAPSAFFLGGFEFDNAEIIGAQAVRFTYELVGSLNETVQDIVYEYMGEWQRYWEEHVVDYADDIEIVYYTDRSFDDEIDRVITGDAAIFGLALITMLIYLMFTLGKVSCIGARPWLALSAIFVMICALLMGFSISLCLGTQFNVMVILVPYILLGVGVDDMIILVDSYDQTAMPEDDILKADIRLGNALAVSGLSISLTSFCSSMAFFVGSASDIPGIHAFCMYAAWSFLANYILQFLIFVPLMVMDDKRIRNRKNFCCPCVVHAKRKNDASQINFFDPERAHGTSDSPRQWRCNANSLMQVTLIPCLARRPCRCIVIVLFIATFVGSIYVLPDIKTDSDSTKLIPDDSYIVAFLDKTNDIYGGNAVDELQIVLKDLDFSDANIRQTILDMMSEFEAKPHALGITSNWLVDFDLWLMHKGKDLDTLSSGEFYQELQIFGNTSSPWHSKIVYNDPNEPSEIQATRFELKIAKSINVMDGWAEYLEWNAIIEEYISDISDDSFAFIPMYSFAYLSNSIVGFTVDNMIFAGIGIAGILLLLFDLRMAVFILCVVSMIDIHLFGWMWLMDISLDTLTYAQCVMAVGLTVDYVIHIVHAIEEVKGLTFERRLNIALSTMGASVCKGAFTTFLGGICLLFSTSEAFRIFFYMFSGIILIATAHGMILTPALLGELWFVYLDESPPSNEEKSAKGDVHGIVANLTIAHVTHTHGNSSNISRSDLDQIYEEAIKTKPTTVAINDTGGTKEKKKANKRTQNSIEMANYNHKDSDDSSADIDQFED
eukprot:136161_1